jgi:RNA polymerase sigma factor for flagellar operon FliA
LSERNDMIIRHLPLVAFVVGRMATDSNGSAGLDREDAMAYGVQGLIQAVDGFDPERGTTFASFAVRRIRGSILDAIRKEDPLPRSLRKAARELDHASQELACQLGRWPSHKELALRLGLGRDQLEGLLARTSTKTISLEWSQQDRGGDGSTRYFDPPDDDELADPALAAERAATLRLLGKALEELSPRDRSILLMRYHQGRPFHEIGDLMGLSESRVCQLHKRILGTLRQRLRPALDEAA